jgi:hypothetical protein
MTILTAVIAFGTIGMAIVIYFQYRNSRNNSEKQLRAYVGIDSEDVLSYPENSTERMLARFKIENFGKTPAYEFTYWLNHQVFSASEATFDNVPAPNPVYSALNPRAITHIHVNLTEEEWTDAEKRMADNDSSFYFWGEIRYNDVFGIPHWNRFRFRTEEGIRPFYTIRLCDVGNDTDKN